MLNHVQVFAIKWTAACQTPVLHYLPEFAQTYVHCCYLTISSSSTSFFSLQSFPTAGSFSELAFCIKWPKYWSFRFSDNPSSEYSRFISFRSDWFYHLAVQGTLKSLLQHHNSKASVLQHSIFSMVQHLHPYMATGKTIALTIQTFDRKWCLCFLVCCLCLPKFSFQRANVSEFHGCSHCPQWFWRPRK